MLVVEKVLYKRKCTGTENPDELEYLVKFKGLSYLHVAWVSAADLEANIGHSAARSKITRYEEASANSPQGSLLLPEYTEIDRILDYTGDVEIDWKTACARILGKVFQYRRNGIRWADPFSEPVDPERDGAPGYFDIVKEPMDFGTIRKKLGAAVGGYTNHQQFAYDVRLVFRNCEKYNSDPDTDIRMMSAKLEEIFEKGYEAAFPGDTNENDKMCLVKWKGLSYTECTWEKVSDLEDIEEMLEKYRASTTIAAIPIPGSSSRPTPLSPRGSSQSCQLDVTSQFQCGQSVQTSEVKPAVANPLAVRRRVQEHNPAVFTQLYASTPGQPHAFSSDRRLFSLQPHVAGAPMFAQGQGRSVPHALPIFAAYTQGQQQPHSRPHYPQGQPLGPGVPSPPPFKRPHGFEPAPTSAPGTGYPMSTYPIGNVPLSHLLPNFPALPSSLRTLPHKNTLPPQSAQHAMGYMASSAPQLPLVVSAQRQPSHSPFDQSPQVPNCSPLESFAESSVPSQRPEDGEKEPVPAEPITPTLNSERTPGSPASPRKTTKDLLSNSGRKLRSYQEHGVRWLCLNHYKGRSCILADEMGLGKTVQTSVFLSQVQHAYQRRSPALVIAPLVTIQQWKREIEEWTKLYPVVYHDTSGGKETRDFIRYYEFYKYRKRAVPGTIPDPKKVKSQSQNAFPSAPGMEISERSKIPGVFKVDVLITSYEIFLTDLSDLVSIPWSVVVVDEAHRLKNQKGRLNTALRQLKCKLKVLLTGTPLQNNSEELWTLMNVIDPKRFPSVTQFDQEFGGLSTAEDVTKLHAALRPYILRRVKEEVEKSIPPKEETLIDIELTTIQKYYYRALYERNRTILYASGKPSAAPSLKNLEMQLRKCCNHPFLLEGIEDRELKDVTAPEDILHKTIEASGKFVLVDKLLRKMKADGHKVLIFSQFTRVLDMLEHYLEDMGYVYERLDGGVKGSDRQASIDRFNDEEQNRFVFLLSTRAGGVGVNLTSADTVIIFDSDWNPQNDVQATSRCHRIGQTQEVKVYRLLTRGTYESTMFERASKKLGLERVVMGQTSAFQQNGDTSVPIKLDKEEVDLLLRYGAYGVLVDDDDPECERARKFVEADIDDILQQRTRTVKFDELRGTAAFSKSYFRPGEADVSIDMDDPDFWNKVLPESAAELSAAVLAVRLNSIPEGENGHEAAQSFMSDLRTVAKIEKGPEEAAELEVVVIRALDREDGAFTVDNMEELQQLFDMLSSRPKRRRASTMPKDVEAEIADALSEADRMSDAAHVSSDEEVKPPVKVEPKKEKLVLPESLDICVLCGAGPEEGDLQTCKRCRKQLHTACDERVFCSSNVVANVNESTAEGTSDAGEIKETDTGGTEDTKAARVRVRLSCDGSDEEPTVSVELKVSERKPKQPKRKKRESRSSSIRSFTPRRAATKATAAIVSDTPSPSSKKLTLSLKLPRPTGADWVCGLCFAGKQICSLCNETDVLGTKDSKKTSNGATNGVLNCAVARCGRYYHVKCVKESWLGESTFQTNTAFRCPQHYCYVCTKTGDGQTLLTCMLCPQALHSRCVPDHVRISKKAVLCFKCVHTKIGLRVSQTAHRQAMVFSVMRKSRRGRKPGKASTGEGDGVGGDGDGDSEGTGNARSKGGSLVVGGDDADEDGGGCDEDVAKDVSNVAGLSVKNRLEAEVEQKGELTESESEAETMHKDSESLLAARRKRRRSTPKPQSAVPCVKDEDVEELLSVDWTAYSGRWCRYCGARSSSSWRPSPWGSFKLCTVHYNDWSIRKRLALPAEEPAKPIAPGKCTEKAYLYRVAEKRRKFVARREVEANNSEALESKKPKVLKLRLPMIQQQAEAAGTETETEDDVDSDACALAEEAFSARKGQDGKSATRGVQVGEKAKKREHINNANATKPQKEGKGAKKGIDESGRKRSASTVSMASTCKRRRKGSPGVDDVGDDATACNPGFNTEVASGTGADEKGGPVRSADYHGKKLNCADCSNSSGGKDMSAKKGVEIDCADRVKRCDSSDDNTDLQSSHSRDDAPPTSSSSACLLSDDEDWKRRRKQQSAVKHNGDSSSASPSSSPAPCQERRSVVSGRLRRRTRGQQFYEEVPSDDEGDEDFN